MSQQIKKITRKILLFFYFSIPYSRKIDIFYIKRLVSDQAITKHYDKWYRQVKKTQINTDQPLFLDRQNEVKEYFNISSFYLLQYFLKYGFPNTVQFHRNLDTFFEGKTASDKLKKAYEEASFHYVLMLMLGFESYPLILEYLDFMLGDFGKNWSKFRVLDYGCGVSDIGLLFASLGADVTICDLDDRKLDFTIWRFKKRGLNPKVIRVLDTEVYPPLPESEFDLIIATEIFEHVREPLKLLKNFTKSLRNGGYLFDSMGGTFERELVGDHLKESLQIGNSREFREFYNDHFLQVFPGERLNCLFKKVK